MTNHHKKQKIDDNFVQIGGSKNVPICPEREERLKQTLQQLGLHEENPGIYPVVLSKNATPQVERYDPSTGKCLAKIQNATWEQTSALLDHCAEAQNKWKKLSGDERVDIVLKMNQALFDKKEALANLETFEIGKIPTESSGELVEIFDVAETIKQRRTEVGGKNPHFIRHYDSTDPSRKKLGWKGQELLLPVGIVGKMTAFNFPYAVFAWGALPALAAGNGVILKPHPDASLTSLAMIKILADVAAQCGFPGLVGITIMSDWALTRKLWEDPRLAMWEVTGSVSMGKAFLEAVSPSFRRSILELGGNNAVIIHKDANVSNAVQSCLFGASGTAGQRCTSTRIIYAHENIYEEFTEKLKDSYQSKLRIGDPFQPGVNIGPVHHQRQKTNFEEGIKHYVSHGSKILIGGNVIQGNFVEPTLMIAPQIDYEAIKEERFVPISHIVKYSDNQIDNVINFINKTGYGLSGGIFTRDDDLFMKLCQEIRVGIFNKNYGTSGAEAGENFGGEGKTGNARMLGPEMFKHYTRYVNSMMSPPDSKVIHAQGVDIDA